MPSAASAIPTADVQSFLFRTRTYITFLLFFALFICYAFRSLLSVAIIPLSNQHQYDNQSQGYINSAFFLGYIWLQIPGGYLATSRWKGRRTLNDNNSNDGRQSGGDENDDGLMTFSIVTIGRFTISLVDQVFAGITTGSQTTSRSTHSSSSFSSWWWLSTSEDVGYIGGYPVLLMGVLLPSLFTLLTPPVAGSFTALIIMRIGTGLFEGLAYPAVHALASQWIPQEERSRAVGFIWSGAYLGSSITLPLCGYILNRQATTTSSSSSSSSYWPYTFYLFGFLGLIWSALWYRYAASAPEYHGTISNSELEYILSTRSKSTTSSSRPHSSSTSSSASPSSSSSSSSSDVIPWRKMIKHPAVLALIASHTCHNYLFFVLLTWLPSYLHQILEVDVATAAWLSLYPNLACACVSIFSGWLGDILLNRGRSNNNTGGNNESSGNNNSNTISRGNVRKGMQILAEICPAIAISMVGFTTNVQTAIILLTIAVGFTGFNGSGYAVNHLDIAPQYAGLLMGMSNSVASLPGVIGPIVVGELVRPPHNDIAHWRLAFFLAAAIAVIGCVLFVRYGEAEPIQEFIVITGDDDDGDEYEGTNVNENKRIVDTKDDLVVAER